jgi:hypothetical protein
VTNTPVSLIIANIYALDENYEAALKVLHSVDAASLLESSALAIQMHLKLDRHDLAKKELKRLTRTQSLLNWPWHLHDNSKNEFFCV